MNRGKVEEKLREEKTTTNRKTLPINYNILRNLKSYYNLLLYFLVNLNSTSLLKLSKPEPPLTIGSEERNKPDNISTVIRYLAHMHIQVEFSSIKM